MIKRCRLENGEHLFVSYLRRHKRPRVWTYME